MRFAPEVPHRAFCAYQDEARLILLFIADLFVNIFLALEVDPWVYSYSPECRLGMCWVCHLSLAAMHKKTAP